MVSVNLHDNNEYIPLMQTMQIMFPLVRIAFLATDIILRNTQFIKGDTSKSMHPLT